MRPSERTEYSICEIFRRDRAVGLGFSLDRTHVVTCAHVVNAALERGDKRDPARPGHSERIRLRFSLGTTPGDEGYRAASVAGWLPAEAGTFDVSDIAVLELTEPAPAHVPGLRPVRYRPLMPVQMWGPQPSRPDGGHVRGELLGEVRGGRIQINVRGGRFRVRTGFSGGPVWDSGSGDVAGVLSACGAEDNAVDAYLLGMDRVAAAWPGWSPRELSDDSRGGRRRDLLDEVAEAARHHPDFAHAEIYRAAEGGGHLVATVEIRAGSRVLGSVRQPIGAHDGDVTAELVAEFAATVGVYRQPGTGGAVGTLVYTGQPAPSALCDLAARSGVDLRSFAEFQTGVDLRPFAERQHQELTADPRYPQHGYVPQRYTEPPYPGVTSTALIDSLLGWLAEPDGYLVVVLAPFGHGKTYLLYELARQMHDRPDYPAIPVLVRLRDLEKNHDVDDLIAAQLRLGGERRIDMDRLEYLRREGRIVLLFDGFDELARRVSYDQAAAHLAAIVQAAEGRAKVVLTSRREYFLTDADAPAALGRRLLTRAGRRVVQITDFDPGQIHMFLAARHGDDAAGKFLALLEDTRLVGLATNPRMLSLLTEIGEDGLGQMGRSGTAVTRASVFEQMLDGWLTGEYERLHPHGSQPSRWVAALRTAVTALAVKLWSSGAASLTLADLEAQAGALMAVPGSERLDHNQAVHVLGSGSILVRVGDRQFDFVHRSLMEWLAVVAIAAQLGRQDDHDTLLRLTARPLTSLQTDLLAELVDLDTISGWVQEAVEESDDHVRGNALAVAQQLGITLAQPPVLRGQDLRGHDLTGRDLAGADLTNADLTEALLDGADLRRANLTGAIVTRTRLDRANLSGAVLDQADLHDARLLGADLRSVAWRGLRSVRRVTTVGAEADQSAATALAAGGATLPDQAAELQSSGGITDASSFSFDPDGELIAVACGALVQIWNVTTGVMIRMLAGHSGTVTMVAWSPDGRHIASASRDTTIRIWDTRTGSLERALAGHTDWVPSIAWSPDSRHLASASRDKTVRIWDTNTGEQIRTRPWDNSPDWVVWSPNGRYLAADALESVQIWEADTGQQARILTTQTGLPESVAWSPDGHRFACADGDNVQIWDTNTGEHIQTLTGHSSWTISVAWSPDGRYLISGSRKDAARIWDTASGMPVQILTSGRVVDYASAVAWSPDGRYVAVGDRWWPRIYIWDAHTWERVQTLAGYTEAVTAVAWSPDDRHIATSSDDGQGRIWDASTGVLHQTWRFRDYGDNHYPVAWSPDGRHLAHGVDARTVNVLDAATMAEIRSLSGEIWGATVGYRGVVAWSPDSRYIAHGGNQGTISIFDADTGDLLRTLDAVDAFSAAWSPDGRHLATCSHSEVVRIWGVRPGTSTRAVTVGRDHSPVRSVAWSPDSRHFATGGGDDAVRIWDRESGTQVQALTGPSDNLHSVAWSPDGQQLAAGSENMVLIWDIRTGELLHTLLSNSAVSATAWSPDSQRLAAGYHDNTMRIWHTAAGTLLGTSMPLADGWAVLYDNNRYAYDGTLQGEFWWVVGLARFETGELEPHIPELRRVPAGAPMEPQP
jgi:WD40 repeat protein